MHLPLKQGLRQKKALPNFTKCVVRVHLPLKQGLRLINSFIIDIEDVVRVHLPLKQGLRLGLLVMIVKRVMYECIFH